MKLQTLQRVIGVKVAYIINKSSLVGKHAVPLMEIVGCVAKVIHAKSCVV